MTTIPKYSAEHQSVRDTLIHEAIRAGKLLPSRYQHYASMYDADPRGTASLLASLAPIPGGAASVTGTAPPADSDYDPSWLTPAERARLNQAGNRHRTATHAMD